MHKKTTSEQVFTNNVLDDIDRKMLNFQKNQCFSKKSIQKWKSGQNKQEKYTSK